MAAIPPTSLAVTASNPNPDSQTTPQFDSADIDIRVTQNDKVVKWKVSSHALVLASPVWKKFVFPPWPSLPAQDQLVTGTENSLDSEPSAKELDFEEDDNVALLLLLKIAHLQFTDVPAKLSYEELMNVAILCDKYDCVKLVKPWVFKWCQIVEKVATIGTKKHDYMFVAWLFGRQKVFNLLAGRLLYQVKTNESSECLTASGEKLSHLLPAGLIENMLKIRAEIIIKLLDMYLEIPVKYRNRTCKVKCLECSTLLCGSIMRPLVELGIWSIDREAYNYFGSINDFYWPLVDIQISTSQGHFECKDFENEIRSDVWAIVNKLPDALLPSHHNHFTKELLELCG